MYEDFTIRISFCFTDVIFDSRGFSRNNNGVAAVVKLTILEFESNDLKTTLGTVVLLISFFVIITYSKTTCLFTLKKKKRFEQGIDNSDDYYL